MKKNQLIFCWTFIFSRSVKPRSICYLQWLITSLSLTRYSVNCYRQSSTYNTVKVSTYCGFVNILLWKSLILHSWDIFLILNWNFSYLFLLTFALSPLVPDGITEKSHPLYSLSSHALIKTPLSFFFSRWNSPSSYLPPPNVRCSKPIIIFTALPWIRSRLFMSPSHWGAQDQTQPSRCVSPGWA